MDHGCDPQPNDEGAPTLRGSQLLRAMAKVAVTPSKVALLLVLVLAALVCGRLGVWQLDRAYERANLAQQHEIAESEVQEPVALAQKLKPQETFGGDLVGQRVTVSGTYEPGNQLLVTGRSVNGESGFLILDSLLVTEDGSNGASWENLSGNPRLPVVRGWVPSNAVDASGALSDEWADRARTPEQEVTLVGWLQASESTLTVSLPQGQTQSVSSAALANEWGGPMYGGYLVVSAGDEAAEAGLTMLPRPQIEGSDGLNTQNLFYALQWWVFGLFAVALWLRLVRDEALRSADGAPHNPFDVVDRLIEQDAVTADASSAEPPATEPLPEEAGTSEPASVKDSNA